MSQHSAENPNPPTPGPDNLGPIQPDDFWTHLDDSELQAQFSAAKEQEEIYFQRAGKIADKIGPMVTANQLRASNLYGSAAALHDRPTTNSTTRGSVTQKIDYDKDGNVKYLHDEEGDVVLDETGQPVRAIEQKTTRPHSRMQESATSRTLAPLTGKIHDKYSLTNPDTSEKASPMRPRAPHELPPDPAQLSARQRRQQVRAAKRAKKQMLRAARAEDAETTFGAGKGLYGEKAPIRSALAKRSAAKEVQDRYDRGEISAQEMLYEKELAKGVEVQRPVKAVRRVVARERIAGAVALNQDEQLVRHTIRSHRLKKAIDSLHDEALEVNQAKDTQVSIERELARRNGDPEWDKIGLIVPLPTQGEIRAEQIRQASEAAEARAAQRTRLPEDEPNNPYHPYFNEQLLLTLKNQLYERVKESAKARAEFRGLDRLPDAEMEELYRVHREYSLNNYVGTTVPDEVMNDLRIAFENAGNSDDSTGNN